MDEKLKQSIAEKKQKREELLAERERLEKERIEKEKLILANYLLSKGVITSLNKVTDETWAADRGEFKVYMPNDKIRYYDIHEVRYHTYGEDWFKCHEYKDIEVDGITYRISVGYFLSCISYPIRSISIGAEKVYTFRKRTGDYKKKTDNQMDYIVAGYVKEYILAGCPGNANIDILRSTIKYELSKLYLKTWIDYLKEDKEKAIQKIKSLCNHKRPDGSSAIKYVKYYDIHKCAVCGAKWRREKWEENYVEK